MTFTHDELRRSIEWHREYRPQWDDSPDEYERAGIVGWGRTRRLGVYRSGRIKAYLGVQHVDTTKPGWGMEGEPHACFFISLFLDGRVMTLRTFPRVSACLDALREFLLAVQS